MKDKSSSPSVTTTLRIPEERNAYLKQKASEIGVSQNALILMLLDIGIKCYENNLSYSSAEGVGSTMRDLIR